MSYGWIIVSVLLLGAWLPTWIWYKKRLAGMISTEGEIVRIESNIPGRDGTRVRSNMAVFPVFRFSDESGREHEIRSTSSIVRSRVSVGARLPLRYPPGKPERLEIVRGSFMSPPVFLLIIGTGTLILGLAGLFK